MRADELRAVRGAGIAMIFQDPLSSLHPHYRVGWQIAEMISVHEDMPRRQLRTRAIELLGLVGIPRPESRVDDYPHQFSGGMRQRAMIAMALALNPKVLIADEPTTALDVTVQAQIIDLMRRLQAEFGTAIILITHDLGLVAEIAEDVLVMYAGRAMERTDRRTLFYRAAPSVHARPARVAAGQGRHRRAADADLRPAAEPDPAAWRVSVPPALPRGRCRVAERTSRRCASSPPVTRRPAGCPRRHGGAA